MQPARDDREADDWHSVEADWAAAATALLVPATPMLYPVARVLCFLCRLRRLVVQRHFADPRPRRVRFPMFASPGATPPTALEQRRGRDRQSQQREARLAQDPLSDMRRQQLARRMALLRDEAARVAAGEASAAAAHDRAHDGYASLITACFRGMLDRYVARCRPCSGMGEAPECAGERSCACG